MTLAVPIFGEGRAIGFAAEGEWLNPLSADVTELVDWFNAKETREVGHWRELSGEEYTRAFTAARTAGYDVVGDLEREFKKVLAEEGATGVDFAERVLPILRKKGWLPGLSQRQLAARVQLIFDTNLRVAQAAGRWQRIQRTKTALPYLVGHTARDDRVRLRHRPFEGIVLPVDHPFWERHFPPMGFRCRCSVVQRSRGQIARMGLVETTAAELAEREANMGPTWGFNPAISPLRTARESVERANKDRIAGAEPISFEREQAKALARRDADFARVPVEPREFREPRNAEVNAETIKVRSRAVLARELTPSRKAAAADERYQVSASDRWGGRSPADHGRVSFGSTMSNEAASMVAAIIPELDDLARQAGVPAIRGIKSIGAKAAGADMGDGVLGLQPATLDFYASRVGGRGPVNVMAVKAERSRIRIEHDELSRQFRASLSTGDAQEQERLIAAMAKLRERDKPLYDSLKRVGPTEPASTWKPGDDVAKQPRGSADYFADGVDKARSLLYHEFAHHIHQNLNKIAPRRATRPPLELELVRLWQEVRGSAERRGRQLSTYGLKNEHEWFAENFAAFAMGRRDLVDPTLDRLIERIFRGEFA